MSTCFRKGTIVQLVQRRLVSSFRFDHVTSTETLRRSYLELAKKHHPDVNKHQSQHEKDAANASFVALTRAFKDRLRALEVSDGRSFRGYQGVNESNVADSFDDALSTFLGVLDPLQRHEILRELGAAHELAGGVPAGLDKGGYWGLAASFGVGGDLHENVITAGNDKMVERGASKFRRTKK